MIYIYISIHIHICDSLVLSHLYFACRPKHFYLASGVLSVVIKLRARKTSQIIWRVWLKVHYNVGIYTFKYEKNELLHLWDFKHNGVSQFPQPTCSWKWVGGTNPQKLSKGPATLKSLVKLRRICGVRVLPGVQMDSKVDHNSPANWDWWKYDFWAIRLAIYG